MKQSNFEIMPLEDGHNILILCKDCSDQRKDNWQEKNRETKIIAGTHCKIPFTDENGTEHMWVKVMYVKDKTYAGILDNIPMVVENIRHNDIVGFLHQDIEDYKPD